MADHSFSIIPDLEWLDCFWRNSGYGVLVS